jgi:hypothetical protein
MSYSFEARFSPAGLALPEVLGPLEKALADSRIHFEGQIMRLESHEGAPTAMSADIVAVENLADVARVARKWWGAGLFCVSETLMKALGKTDAVEVTFNLFRAASGGTLLTYSERKGAQAAREQSEDLANDLQAMLVRVCAALQIEIAIYGEEGDEGLQVPDLDEVRASVERAAAASALPGMCLVVATRLMTLEAARTLAGPLAARVRLATAGYLVFSFLGGD